MWISSLLQQETTCLFVLILDTIVERRVAYTINVIDFCATLYQSSCQGELVLKECVHEYSPVFLVLLIQICI
jgi:hypothetical protein